MKTAIAPRIGLPLFLLWLAGSPTLAGNWKKVVDDKQILVEIDVATLARDGNSVKAWERETHRKPAQAKPGDFFFSSTKTLAQHHCIARTTTYLFRGFFAADGSEIKALANGADLGKVDFLVPDSPEERKLKFACAYGTKKPAMPLIPPAPTDNTAEPPAAATKPAAAITAEKIPQKSTSPAKSAARDRKSPVEPQPEKPAETKAKASTQTSPAPSGKSPAGK